MSGYHGTVGAIGVRPSVCPEPLRRAFLLAGLVLGIVFTGWSWSAPAHAEEAALTGSALSGTDPIVVEAKNVGDSVGDTLATVRERVTHATGGAIEVAQVAETAPIRHVHETVRDTSLTQDPPHSSELTETLTRVTVEAVDPVLDHRGGPARAEVAGATETNSKTVETDEPTMTGAFELRLERAVPDEDRTPDTVIEVVDERRGFDQETLHTTSVSGNAPTTSSSSGGTSPAPVVAGFLPGHSDPAPVPGLFEAARHVLLSVPADSTDEPTFSPD